MEPNMDTFIKNIETDFDQLHDSLEDMKAENRHLHEEKFLLEKAFEKQKNFHRKYVDDVAATEAIRIQDYNKEKRELTEEKKALIKVNRQLAKDLEFYKSAHEELAKHEPSVIEAVNYSEPNSNRRARATSTTQSQTVSKSNASKDIKQKSLKEVTKINLSLFEENKKLQAKLSDVSSRNALLIKKVKQLENFQKKIENKKSKFHRDSEELERLVDSSKKKNRDVYTPEVLEMLGNLAKNKK